MSLLGIDVGTTGCKVVAFSLSGETLASAYREYPIHRPARGRAELESKAVWQAIGDAVRETAATLPGSNPPTAVAASSLGEAVVPVRSDRTILGPSIMNIDERGNDYLPALRRSLADEELHRLNGNTWGKQFGATKLMWLKKNDAALYEATDYFLHWGNFVGFMLGADPFVDYSLANRSLLFDLQTCDWSETLVSLCGLDREKLPPTVPSGTVVGSVSSQASDSLGLPAGIPIVSGAHDQCANATGCGAILDRTAMYGMGTFPTIAPVYAQPGSTESMIELGLNTEHHAVAGLFASFIFHMGGSIVTWFRDLLSRAAGSDLLAGSAGSQILDSLFAGLRNTPSGLLLLPHFVPMGPPDWIADQCGLMLGMNVETTACDILQAVVEGNAFALNMAYSRLHEAAIAPESVRVVGGGSRSDRAVQINADILGTPLLRPNVVEAGALGSALLAGSATGSFASLAEAAEATIRIERTFEPDRENERRYREVFARYREIRSAMGEPLREWQKLVVSDYAG